MLEYALVLMLMQRKSWLKKQSIHCLRGPGIAAYAAGSWRSSKLPPTRGLFALCLDSPIFLCNFYPDIYTNNFARQFKQSHCIQDEYNQNIEYIIDAD
jgi:hypothetical protein